MEMKKTQNKIHYYTLKAYRQRINSPYGAQPLPNGEFIFVNRYYKPIGVDALKHVNYKDYPSFILDLPLSVQERMNSYRASNDWFLFGDGNAPWARHTTAGERKEYEALKMEVDALLKKRYKHTFEDIVFLNQNIQAKGKEGMAMERNSYFSRNPPVGRNLHPGRWLLA